ncbi:MAG: hypothetical protein J0M24_24690 [Verrucomicrobia bacterium]|nr:hypothetical protein [Verrucomicrobiota bacterium]
MKTRLWIAVGVFGLGVMSLGRAESSETNAVASAASSSPTATTPHWEYSGTVMGYLVPDSQDYVQPTLTADRAGLHLEARYNYEALESGSLWIGWNLGFGQTVEVAVTPMVGGVVGNLRGVAPGCLATISWWKLTLYSEAEYVFDLGGPASADDFFYSWSELSLAPVEWMRFGVALQRTRVFSTGLEVQRGVLLGASWKSVDFTAYVFNFGWEDPTVVLSLGVSF